VILSVYVKSTLEDAGPVSDVDAEGAFTKVVRDLVAGGRAADTIMAVLIAWRHREAEPDRCVNSNNGLATVCGCGIRIRCAIHLQVALLCAGPAKRVPGMTGTAVALAPAPGPCPHLRFWGGRKPHTPSIDTYEQAMRGYPDPTHHSHW
jgi:hypothetical protein